MSAGRPIRLGLLGCGRIAEHGYAPAAGRVPDLSFVAVADPDPARRELLARLCGARACDSAAAIAGVPELDGVVVATPVGAHVASARTLAAAGLPTLVEKPPSADAAGAADLARLDPSPRIGFNRRFGLGSGLLAGRPAAPAAPVELQGSIAYRRRSWDPLGELGDPLEDLGPHLLDLALLAGLRDLRPVRAQLGPRRARVELAASNGRAVIGCAIDRSHRERLRVTAAGRTVAAADAGGLRGHLGRLRGAHPLLDSLVGQLRAFADELRGGERAALASAEQGVAVMELLDAIRAHAAGTDVGRRRAEAVG